MITPDRGALKRWRRGVKRRLKASPGLWREFKRNRSRRITHYTWGKFRVLVPIGIVGMVVAGIPAMAMANGLLLWTTLLTFARGQQISVHLHHPNLLWLWYGWPVSDDEVYAHQRSLVLRSSVWLGVDWLVFGLAAAWHAGDAVMAVAAPVLAAGQWAMALAIAMWLVRWRPQFPFGWFITPFTLLMFLALRFGHEHNALSPYIALLFDGLGDGTPAGWLTQGFGLIAAGHAAGWALLLGLGGIAAAALIKGAGMMRKTFDPAVLFGYEAVPSEVEDVGATTDKAVWSPEAGLHRETAPVDMGLLRVRMREVFDTPAGRSLTGCGPAEQAIGWFLNERQRMLVDFMIPRGMPWMRRWLIATALLAIVPVVRATGGELAALPAIAALAFALPLTGGRWMGFEAMRTFQSQIGLTSYVPAGFWEISRLVLTLNALFCLVAFPLVLAGVWLAFAPANAPAAWALDYSVRGLVLVVALQPVWLLAKFSANTNDSSSGRWFFLVSLMLLILVGLIAGVSLGVTAMMVEKTAVALGCLGGLMILTHATLAIYGWAWGRGWFDLIAKMK